MPNTTYNTSTGVTTLNPEEIRSIVIQNLSEVAAHKIKKTKGGHRHELKFHNGNHLHVLFDLDGKVLDFDATVRGCTLKKDGQLTVDTSSAPTPQ